ncbi:ABC-three component system protein [Bosea sp. (in: a-proteobacteria)]|jgi:hypothetical protein|uniref:ABC-three component system protein n=1 Tax=Bosea sp. (in: a-proteobacteria) TaxID=1871050 RepID=UPI0025C30008|nr:ABC-three component system protein [Bosea sp. (in: a-proteobacteria)]
MLRRDYRLHELNDAEFEGLVLQICARWLGQGVTGFATGKDGGRDGKFHGTANSFPSASSPLVGHCTLQAKHTGAPNKSCSDREFDRLLKGEYDKIKRLVAAGLLEHYIVFTNRKYSGLADEKLIAALMKLGLKSAYIIGEERLHQALDEFADIRDSLPNKLDPSPFRFDSDDIVEVIGALHSYTENDTDSAFRSAFDFEKLKIQDKNTLNGVSETYYQQAIVGGSMPHFERVEQFLTNPRNADIAALYHDSADELKQKIVAKRAKFDNFDDIFGFLYDQIQEKKDSLRGKRRLITILVHYMYCNCDIGSKDAAPKAPDHAHA